MTAFWGSRDRRISRAHVSGWARFFGGGFELLRIDGNHLWPLDRDGKREWLAAIAERLDDAFGDGSAAAAAG